MQKFIIVILSILDDAIKNIANFFENFKDPSFAGVVAVVVYIVLGNRAEWSLCFDKDTLVFLIIFLITLAILLTLFYTMYSNLHKLLHSYICNRQDNTVVEYQKDSPISDYFWNIIDNKFKFLNYSGIIFLIILFLLPFICTNFAVKEIYNIKNDIRYTKLAETYGELLVCYKNRKFVKYSPKTCKKELLKEYDNPMILNIKSNEYHYLGCSSAEKCTQNCIIIDFNSDRNILKESNLCRYCKRIQDEASEYADACVSEENIVEEDSPESYRNCFDYYFEEYMNKHHLKTSYR